MGGGGAAVFAQSVLIGLSIAAPVGQIGVLAIQRTIEQGRAAGLATGLGAALADSVYGAVGAFGMSKVMAWLLGLKTGFALGGAAFLLWLAWKMVRRPVAAVARHGSPRTGLWRCLGGTFVLTLSNPTTVLSFLAIFATLAARTPTASPWAMVAGVLAGSALWWLVLAGLVGLVRERFDARWRKAVNLLSAGVLAAFAVWQVASLAG